MQVGWEVGGGRQAMGHDQEAAGSARWLRIVGCMHDEKDCVSLSESTCSDQAEEAESGDCGSGYRVVMYARNLYARTPKINT